jgi:hypothetical protein
MYNWSPTIGINVFKSKSESLQSKLASDLGIQFSVGRLLPAPFSVIYIMVTLLHIKKAINGVSAIDVVKLVIKRQLYWPVV